ncbi:unnamed protein product [Owenia fusiformis]|uniref:Uncharacterized protein n=1 Tax=Owenia fusiformis TaxID=6347 RepID=A0A8J1TIQ1_OWEFU|nr:unnamed protein product [Owenia fusiformis]
MEEVDKIIVHTLKGIGCDVEDVQSLVQFSTELIIEATVRCLKMIDPQTDLPMTLPPAMAARFRLGTSLASAITELGYKGELGYQTFLYSNEADIRRVLMFLIEKLPRGSEESTEEILGGSAVLYRSIASELSKRLSSPWTPPQCKNKGVVWRGSPPTWHREGCSSVRAFRSAHLSSPHGLGDLTKKIPKDVKTYYTKHMPYILTQPVHRDDLAASILENNATYLTAQHEWDQEWNQLGLASRLTKEEYLAKKRDRLQKRIKDNIKESVKLKENAQKTPQDLNDIINSISERSGLQGKTKGSRFTHAEKLQFTQDVPGSQMTVDPTANTEEELKAKREEEIEKLQEQLERIATDFENLDIEIRKFTASSQQMEEIIATEATKNKEKETVYKVKKRTLDLLPDADNNIAKLQSVVDTSAQRLVSLANQWEKHRVPLVEKYREMKALNENRESEAEKKLEEIKAFREKMKDVAADARTKEDIYKQLVTEYERMTKDVNRSAYTRRIMEIVSNIKKQKQEIDKILIDTKSIQKDINQLSGKLDRTFTVTDELIFRDAKKDEAVRKAYKYLAALHENCDILIKTVEETGFVMREIRDLEDQIDIETNKKVLDNLDKITADYKQMKKENAHLLAKLKGK